MTLTADLTGSLLRTYTTLFQHPISYNLGWRDVHTLLRKLGDIHEEPNGNLKVTRNGHSLVLHSPRSKDVDTPEEIMALRKFIGDSDTPDPVVVIGPDFDLHGRPVDHTAHRLLVIDHHEARLFRMELKDGALEHLTPHGPDKYFRHVHNSLGFSRGEEKPEPNSFFEPVAKELQGSGEILVFGTGTGKSNEMDQFIAWVKVHHPDLSRRIIGAVVVNEQHLTVPQLLATARGYHGTHSTKL